MVNIKLSRIRLFLSDIKPLLLSHHPSCQSFSDHVYHVGKHKLCIGCFTFYPTIAITIIILVTFFGLSVVNLMLMFIFSFIFFIPIILNFFNLSKNKFLKILSKISIGIGTGLLIISTILLPFHILIKISLLIEINFITGVIAYIRAKHVKEICSKCEYEANWDDCPAMKPIMDNLYEHKFKKLKVK
jgi:hypothetical protein